MPVNRINTNYISFLLFWVKNKTRLNCFNVTAICFAEVEFVVGQICLFITIFFRGRGGCLKKKKKIVFVYYVHFLQKSSIVFQI